MSMIDSKAITAFKQEVTYNTDPAPGVTDAVITGPVKWAIEADMNERKIVLPYYGLLPDIPNGTAISLEFDMEFFGSGAAATPPKHGPLFRSIGMSETVAADVKYDELTVTDTDSVTVYWYNDGILYKASGCVVKSAKLNIEAGKPMTITFQLLGMYAGVANSITATGMITPTYGSLQIPPIVQSAAFAIDGYSALISKLEITITNNVVKKMDASSTYGVKRIYVQDREITGSCDPEMVALGTYNPWTSWESGTAGAFTVTVGSSAGNRLIVTMPRVVKEIPKVGARNGIRVYDQAFKATVTTASGNDRIRLNTN